MSAIAPELGRNQSSLMVCEASVVGVKEQITHISSNKRFSAHLSLGTIPVGKTQQNYHELDTESPDRNKSYSYRK